MNANIDFIRDINERYSSLEYELEKKLKTIEAAEAKIEEENVSDGNKSETNEFDLCPSSLNEARLRNRKIIEELEMAKARLRSRTLYSPLETILKKTKENYLAALSTPVVKKIYGPIFV